SSAPRPRSTGPPHWWTVCGAHWHEPPELAPENNLLDQVTTGQKSLAKRFQPGLCRGQEAGLSPLIWEISVVTIRMACSQYRTWVRPWRLGAGIRLGLAFSVHA